MSLQRFSRFLLFQLKSLARSSSWNGCLFTLVCLATISMPGFKPASASAASVEMRVAIEDGVSDIKVGSSTKAMVLDSSGRKLGEIAAMHAFYAQTADGNIALDRWQAKQMWVEPTAGGFVFIGDRWYRGRTLLVPSSKGLTAVNYVDLEQYLYSVLGGEMNGNWPPEALKAQAVAARSYALYQRQRAATGVFDVGDTPGWQVYGGLVDEAAGTQAAVNATKGQVLINSGQIIEAVFHSSAGGCTENVEDVWMQPLPYLRTVKENFQEQSPVANWTVPITRTDLGNLAADIGTVSSVEIIEKTPVCGRVKTARINGDKGSRTISGERLRTALGLKSTLFTIEEEPTQSKQKSTSAGFLIKGRGFGHGLGLSQWGAYNLAQRGINYRDILLYYYKNTILAKIQVK